MTGARLVSIIIVNYNGRDLLLPCLSSVYAQPYRPIEVVVVDNGSVDGSVQAVREQYPGVLLIENRKNNGFAGGNNQGVANASGEEIILLNNDTIVDSGWLSALLAQRDATGAAAVTSKVTTDSVPDEFYTMNGSLNFLGYNIMKVFTDLSMIFFAGGASLLFRKSEFPVPFPAAFFLYQEDVYLSWRARIEGKSVCMAQRSVVYHKGSVTSKRQPGAFVTFYQERNRTLNSLLMYEGKTLLRLLPYFAADAAAKMVRALVSRGKSPVGIVRAYLWIFTHPGWILRERRSIQAGRKVPDRKIMALMSPKITEGHSFAARAANALSRAYARMAGLAFHE